MNHPLASSGKLRRAHLVVGRKVWAILLVDGMPVDSDPNNLKTVSISAVDSRSVTVINPYGKRISGDTLTVDRHSLKSADFGGMSVKVFRHPELFEKWASEIIELSDLRRMISQGLKDYNLGELRRIAKIVGIKDH